MKILIHGTNSHPELIGIGKYTGELAHWLAQRGHEVRIICAPPYYPQWRVLAGYRKWWWSRERVNYSSGGLVDTIRCPLWVPRRPNGLKRLMHLASFAFTSFPAMLISIGWRPKWVLAVEPPLFCAPQSLIVARICGARAWLHVQDFEVDAAYELEVLRRGRRLVEAAERFIMRRFDRVSSISGPMVERLRKKGVDGKSIRQFPNWADLEEIECLPPQAGGLRTELDIEPSAVVALYSGNMGGKQGLEVLSGVAREFLNSCGNVVFVFCGSGAAKDLLVGECEGHPNVRFLPLQPRDRLNELLNMADIHLLPQRADAADLVMPSKLTGMLASGRPVVAGARDGTALAMAIEGCGIAVEPEDPRAMAAAVRKLAEDAALRKSLGGTARRFAEERLEKQKVLSAFECEISETVI